MSPSHAVQPPSEQLIVEGGCLCGAIRYRVTGEPRSCSICHCRSCRLSSGATPVAWFVIQRAQFIFLAGQPNALRSSPPVTRRFCGECGTALTYEHADDPTAIEITTATLDSPETFPPTKEIWLEHKVAWVATNPGLEHFSGESSTMHATNIDGCFASVWEFMVSASAETEFRRHYGPDGSWVRLFRQDPMYIDTLLLKDSSVSGRYLTIDRWRSSSAYRSFRERFSQEYDALDTACQKLTIHEAELGAYLDVSK